MVAGRHLEKSENLDISTITSPISLKFGTEMHRQPLKFPEVKNPMANILKIAMSQQPFDGSLNF